MNDIDLSTIAKNESASIERTIRNVFNCNRFDIGGLADCDAVLHHPITCMVATLTYIYANTNESKQECIDTFIEEYLGLSNLNIEQLLADDSIGFNKIVDNFRSIIIH